MEFHSRTFFYGSFYWFVGRFFIYFYFSINFWIQTTACLLTKTRKIRPPGLYVVHRFPKNWEIDFSRVVFCNKLTTQFFFLSAKYPSWMIQYRRFWNLYRAEVNGKLNLQVTKLGKNRQKQNWKQHTDKTYRTGKLLSKR